MKYLSWALYNIAVLATALYLTLHFESGWWMLLALLGFASMSEKE